MRVLLLQTRIPLSAPRLQPAHGSNYSHLLMPAITGVFRACLLSTYYVTHSVLRTPWDYNGEEQAVVPRPWDAELNGGADK